MLQHKLISIALLAHIFYVYANRPCERSNYCSVGRLKGYIGPLDTAQELRDALEATHFRRELIVFGETRMSDAAQMLARLREAGYGHVLPVMEDAGQCNHMRSIFSPDESSISCGSYAVNDPSGKEYPVKFKYLARGIGMTAWWRKWFTAGRAVVLGYNVMAIDTDVLVLDDWYWRVKQPPLSDFNMLTQNEWGVSFNGGFSYIQNASASGPVAWLLFEALHRVIRWAEDDSVMAELSEQYRLTRQVGLNDQGVLQECLHSAVVGRPIYPAVLAFVGDDKAAYDRLGLTADKMYRAMHDPVYQNWEIDKAYPVTGELAAKVCEFFVKEDCPVRHPDQVRISTAFLKMPHSEGAWPMEVGGYPFNRTPGPLTAAYRQAYADLGVPLWPDPEDPSTAAAAKATKHERFGFMSMRATDEECEGCWAESTWWMSGRHGWWHRQLPGHAKRKVGMGHIWANLGNYKKEFILLHTGWWNWRIAARMAKSRQRLYLANQLCSLNHLHSTVPEVRTVVAFKPDVIHAGLTKAQFVRAVQGLAKVAATLGAIAAWPAAPCDSDWVLTEEARKTLPRPIQHTVPWPYLDTYYTVQPFGDNLQSLQCEWGGFFDWECLCSHVPEGQELGRGMLAVEFHHLVQNTKPVISPETTLLLGAANDAQVPLPGSTEFARVHYQDLLTLNAQSVLLRLQREHMPVHWLDRLVDVPDLGDQVGALYNRWRTRCLALHYQDVPEEQRGRV